MKLFILVLLNLIILSCAKQSTSESTPTSKLISNNLIVAHSLYIVGGQSNAVRMLYAESGQYTKPLHGETETLISDLTPKSLPNMVGFAIGATTISYWLNSIMSKPLTDIISNNCKLSPYLIWYQGESDGTTDNNYLAYQYNLTNYLSYLQSFCPSMQIIEVSIALTANYMITYPQEPNIQKIIQTMPYPWVDAEPYLSFGDLGGAHLLQAGYDALFQEIQTKFPIQP